MSGLLPRLKPRWSDNGVVVLSAWSIALEPFSSAIVFVGPPFFVSLPSLSLPPKRSPRAPKPLQPTGLPIRLWPSEVMGFPNGSHSRTPGACGRSQRC